MGKTKRQINVKSASADSGFHTGNVFHFFNIFSEHLVTKFARYRAFGLGQRHSRGRELQTPNSELRTVNGERLLRLVVLQRGISSGICGSIH
jgi:hypothetical protein